MRIVVLLSLMLSSLVHAGKPTGAYCEKSNECTSKRCFEKYCRPDSNHPGGLGAICEADSHCVSKHCAVRKCGPAKEVKAPKSSPKTGGGGSREVEEEEVEEKPAAPVEQPLPAPTPCSEELMATVYKAKAGQRTYLFYAHDACARNAPEVIARAKELFLAGYGRNFGVTCRTVKEATPEQLACAKKSYDKDRDPKSPRDFDVPSLCLQPKELIACATGPQ